MRRSWRRASPELPEDVAKQGGEYDAAAQQRPLPRCFAIEEEYPERREGHFEGGEQCGFGGGYAPRTQRIEHQPRRILQNAKSKAQQQVLRRDS